MSQVIWTHVSHPRGRGPAGALQGIEKVPQNPVVRGADSGVRQSGFASWCQPM